MATHYAHVLATCGGSGNSPEDAQRPISLDGLLTQHGSGRSDITAVPAEDYMLSPGVMVVRVEATVAELDAIAAAPGNVELFREALEVM